MTDSSPTTPLIPSKVYDILKPTTLVVLPGLGTLYFTIASVWHLPAATEVVGTIAAITTFFGLLLGLSTRSYNSSSSKYDGVIEISSDPDGPTKFSLELDGDPYDLGAKDEVIFRIENLPVERE